MPDDYYVLPYSGEEIDDLLGKAGSATGAVRYDAAQSLTDAQKAQARGNIGAAPGGFGYGEVLNFSIFDDSDGSKFEQFVDSFIDGTDKVIRITELADYPANIYSGNGGFADIRIANNGNAIVNWHGPANVLASSSSEIYHAQKKRLTDGTWHPWEYTNPALALGVEYRTTERYLGKPVYVKVVDCGKFPAPGTSKLVAHGISNCTPVTVTAQMSNSNTVPYVGYYTIGVDNTAITLASVSGVSDLSAHNTVATMRYIKTTD